MSKTLSSRGTARVVPPPSKEVRDQLRGVQQIHPTDTAIAAVPLPSWLGYGSPYPPLMLRKKPKLQPKVTVKPSMAPELKALQDKDKPSCQQGGWNGEDWKDWNDSSDWSQWNSWYSKEEWVQDERYHEKDIVQNSHTCTTHQNDYDEYEYIVEETQDDNEELIKNSMEVLQRHRGTGKRGRSGHPVMGRSGKASSKHAKARNAKPSRVPVGELRYSQLSCGKRFQCGRSVSQLVAELMVGRVRLSSSFLRLAVFETTDSDNNPILKCSNNRRLYALKEYARRSGKEVMVNVEFFSQHTLKQVQRFMHNSDKTDGLTVRMRNGRNIK